MLKLENITKIYNSGGTEVKALKNISLEFRKSEFVSVLGQSGCGKTTLLNIIGGLDRYTSGNLSINGKSTKKFKDKDWDTYRNHSVGFVFQNYNLIPHQTVLSNVELALTLSGVPREERKRRSIEVLKKVGLEDQIYKKPNQMSGGQMQRVAIARALVNDPEILLADEPTGALDSETSIQIMELLKEISKDRLIIMVTHNPEIAEKYSTRLIRLLDGNVVSDSNPYTSTGDETQETKVKKNSKTYMSFFAALSLSFNNLLTKKGRTLLTAFAGSIGIIGIALIMSLSNGVRQYISKVEKDTLSSYPLTIEEATIDTASMLESLMGEQESEVEKEDNKIYTKTVMTDMLSTMSNTVQTNNLEKFKQYLENEGTIKDYSNAIKYGYDLDLNLYNYDEQTKKYLQVNPNKIFYAMGMGEMMDAQANTAGMTISSSDVWNEMLDNPDLLKSQYDVLAGKWPEQFNEVVLVVDKDNSINDFTLYSLGLKDQDELRKKYDALVKGEKVDKVEGETYTFDDLLNLKFKLLLNTDYFEKQNNLWIDKSDDDAYMQAKLNDAVEIKVVGIIRKNEEAVSSSMTSGTIGYLSDLTEYVINQINASEIVNIQKENEKVNVFTGINFPEESANQKFDFTQLTNEQKMYLATLSSEELATIMQNYTENASATYESNLTKLGVVDLNKPSMISIFPKDFESKELITDEIENYNKKQRDDGNEGDVITYSDIVGIMMNSVTSIINIISYILIAFVSISLIVSSIMIGIITYISVLERTREIGILRAIGASKKDISRVFNAETLIVGFVAGIVGIGVTLLLNIPINKIIKLIVNVSGISKLPIAGGIILIVISVILTLIGGLIPAKMASKKDPVEALRTE